MSAKTGFAPQYTTTLAVETQVKAGTITSSPGPMSSAARIRWSAVVQLVAAYACLTWWRSANAFSKAATRGPWVSQPSTSGARAACHSSSPVLGSAMAMLRGLSGIGQSRCAAADRDFRFMRPAPVDDALQAFLQTDGSLESNLFACPHGRADAVAHERRLAARRVVDLLFAAGQLDDHFRERLERSALAGADVVEAVDDRAAHRAQVGFRAVLDRNEIERLAAVAHDRGALALVDCVKHFHDHRDVGALVVLPRAVNVHVTQTDDRQAVAVVEGTRHRFARDFRRAVEILVVERMVLVHWLLHRVAVYRS